jgi:hypothetical protein
MTQEKFFTFILGMAFVQNIHDGSYVLSLINVSLALFIIFYNK